MSIKTIQRIIKEHDNDMLTQTQGQTELTPMEALTEAQGQQQSTSNYFKSPRTRYRTNRKRKITDSFDLDAIRRNIYDFNERKEHLNIHKLLKLKDNGIFLWQTDETITATEGRIRVKV